MAKSLDLRRKELIDSTTKLSLLQGWNDAVSEQKDLGSADYKKLGDVGPLAKKYDVLQDQFRDADNKKKDLMKAVDQSADQADKFTKTTDDLHKEVEDIAEDAHATIDYTKDAKTIEDVISDMEEAIKAQQDANKERKAVFDNIVKNQDAYLKFLIDTHSKFKKAAEALDSTMKSINDQMNRLEDQIRGILVKYSNKATADKKPEVAKAARGVAAGFSG
ncbi:MAG TPA: hypothetical protein VMA53_07840 [Stellaceae bacterium]|nr:hypothetical protein [Stellaceae bacterium]